MKTLILGWLLLFPAPREVPPDWDPTTHSYVGVKVMQLQNLNSPGVEISEVMTGLPAQAAGMKVGDVIQRVNGTQVIDTPHCITLIKAVRVGEIARIEVIRPGQVMPLEIKVRPVVRPKELDVTDYPVFPE